MLFLLPAAHALLELNAMTSVGPASFRNASAHDVRLFFNNSNAAAWAKTKRSTKSFYTISSPSKDSEHLTRTDPSPTIKQRRRAVGAPAGCQPVCCNAVFAPCFACAMCLTLGEYCAKYRSIPGCPPMPSPPPPLPPPSAPPLTPCDEAKCGSEAWNAIADGHSCGNRALWLQHSRGHTGPDACAAVAREFPEQCAACVQERVSQAVLDQRQVNTDLSSPFGWEAAPMTPQGTSHGARNTHDGMCVAKGKEDFDLIMGPAGRVWESDELACRARCARQDVCLAYEFSLVASRSRTYTRCELHRAAISHVIPIQGAVCVLKRRGGH